MANIKDLLRYKEELKLVDPTTQKNIGTVWIKVMGDEDIKQAYKYARVASAALRQELKNTKSIDYIMQIEDLNEQEDQDLYDLVVAGKVNDFTRESISVVVREELPKLEEVAIDPDAPTLQEQETLDKAEDNVEKRLMDNINKYVDERKEALEAELKGATHDRLVELATEQMMNMLPQQEFVKEITDQKGYRGTFKDKDCRIREFDSLDDFKNAHSTIKQQIIDAYDKLEMGPDDIKK